jgi:glycosyltransferase involved in cell wall biosynthesis
MPVRNAEATIVSAVDSIRCQTFTDWELIAVDDSSTDDTPNVLRRLTNEDTRIQLLRPSARGIVAALNQGANAAKGEFIARMDADDISAPERLAEQINWLERHPNIGVVGCLVKFGGDPSANRGYALHVDWLNQLVAPEDIALNRFVESPHAHPTVMFRRELPERHGGYREGNFPEDYELWLRWLEAGVRMAKVPHVLVTWTDSPQRLSRVDPRYEPKAFYAVKAKYLAGAVERTRAGRSVWIWGAGRPTRVRAELLCVHGVEIQGYIDIDPRKWGRIIRGRQIVSPDSMPGPNDALVLGYVAKRGARELIREHLTGRGFSEGQDFWMAA